MKTKFKITAIIVLFLMAGSTVIKAQYGRGTRNAGRTPLDYCMEVPGLTEAQTAKLTALNDAHRKKMDELRVQRQTAPTFEEMNQVGAAMLLEQNDHFAKVTAELNAKQLEYLNKTYTTTRPQAPREVPAYGRGGGRGYRSVAPRRNAGRGYRNVAPGRGRGRWIDPNLN